MGKEENLIPFTSEQSRELAKINGAKGGKASGETRRFKKAINMILDGKAPEQLQAILKQAGIKNPKKLNYIESMLKFAQLKAISKNAKLTDIIKLLEFMRDGIGEMPTQKVEVNSSEQVRQGLDKINEYFAKKD